MKEKAVLLEKKKKSKWSLNYRDRRKEEIRAHESGVWCVSDDEERVEGYCECL